LSLLKNDLLPFSLIALAAANIFFWAPEKGSSEDPLITLLTHTSNSVQISMLLALLAGLFLIMKRIKDIGDMAKSDKEFQINASFAKAVEQLGTYKLEVQLGGIFAMEKIATISPDTHWMVVETLTGYVRENARWEENNAIGDQADNINGQTKNTKHIGIPSDIQSILTILGRRQWAEEELLNLRFLNLRKTNLEKLDMRGAIFERANFRGGNLAKSNLSLTRLAGAFLGEVDLNGANLAKADLRGANLIKSNLRNANLKGADLTGANLFHADLSGANLTNAKLDDTNLSKVNLQKGSLGNIDLTSANLTNTQLNYALYNEDTIFPVWITEDLKDELQMQYQV